MKKHIPNFITSLNLLCGCVGIGYLFRSNLDQNNIAIAAYLIGAAAIFDFLDGMFARLLNVKSAIGKDLDSLADVVSFGVLPGMLMFSLLNTIYNRESGVLFYFPFVAFLIPVFSALRLAKFNTDTRQTESFIGLPTPANGIFFASIPLILIYQPDKIRIITNIIESPMALILLIFIFSILLVAPLPLFSMKFKNFSLAKNFMQYLFIGTSVILIIFLHYVAVPFILVLYIILSIINNSINHEIPG